MNPVGKSRRPNPAEIESAIKRILADELGVRSPVLSTIGAETSLVGYGMDLDSVETIGLVMSIEERFGIRVPDEDLKVETFASLGALVEYIADKIDAQGAQGTAVVVSDDSGN